MKLNKYSWLAVLPMIFTACQDDTLVESQQQDKIYTLSAKMDGGAAMSRAQIVIGNNAEASAGETFMWNEGDSFTLYQGDNDNYTEHVFNIKDYTEEGEGDKKTASFVTNNPALPGEIIAVYPSGLRMVYDQGIMHVEIDFQTELDFSQGTVEEVWKDYFKNNMVMKAKATLSDEGNNSLSFEHLTSLARITYTNHSGKDQQVTDIEFGGDQTFGALMSVWFKYDIIGGGFNNGYKINYKNLIVKDGESFDFYILFGPADFGSGDMHIHIHTAQTDVSRSPLALPISTIAAANNNATKFEAGKRYWFKVTEKPEGLIWSKDDSNVNVGGMGLLTAVSKVYPDVVTVNADNTYTINQEKAAEVVELALSDQGTFESLDGIENFPNLERLYCDRVGLKTLDVSKNQKLKVIEVRENILTELDFSTNPALEEINCSSQNEAMLKSLDVTGNVNLRVLRCNNNTLSSLDLTKNTQLEILQCGVNEFTELNLDNNLELESLELPCNDLTSLDMSKHQNLTYLHCTENHITELDITKNTNLETLNCGNQQPDGTVITVKMTEAQKELWDTNWSQIEYWNSRNVVVSVVESAATITIQNTELSTALQAVLGAENVNLDDNGYAVITKEYAESIKELNLGWRDLTIPSMTGIENFTNLELLTASAANIESCDLSQNTKLYYVDLSFNKIKSLDFSKNSLLNDLNCSFNENLEEVILSGCTALTSINVENTHLSSLVVPNPENVRTLYYGNTQIPVFDLAKFVVLETLDVDNMLLTNLDFIPNTIKAQLTTFFCDDNSLSTLDLTLFPKLVDLHCNRNNITVLNLKATPNLTSLACTENQISSLDISHLNIGNLECGKQKNGISLTLTMNSTQESKWNSDWSNSSGNANVLPNFSGEESTDETTVTILNTELSTALQTVLGAENVKLENGYAVMIKEFAESIVELNLNNNSLTSLAGIDAFKNLTVLECEGNKLTTLDLSEFSNLQQLNCVDNQLTSLDLSYCPKLTNLRCSKNQLTGISVNHLKNLVELDIIDNQLTSLDVSSLTNLKALLCFGNHLASLDLTANTLLESMQLGNQTDIKGNDIYLELRLADSVKTIWFDSWESNDFNKRINLYTGPSIETGSGNTGGNDFPIGGIY